MTETLDRPPGAAPGRPGVVPLRPLLAGEILDGAVTAMRAYPGIMLGLSAVAVALGQVVAVPLDYLYLRFLSGLVGSSTTAGGGSGINVLASLRPGTLIDFLTQTVLTGLLTVTVSRAVLGRPITLDEVWRTTRPRLARLVGLALLVVLVAVGPGIACVTAGVMLSSGNSGAGGILIFVGFVGGGIWALYRWVSWLLGGAALLLEDQKVTAALKRSALLVKAGWWRVFGIALLAMLVAVLCSGVLAIVQQYFGGKLNPATANSDGTVSTHHVTWLAVVINATFTTAVQAISAPFVASVTALQYIDRRMRREGLDIQLARSAATGTRSVNGDGGAGGQARRTAS
jgi:hypothetical protein